MRITLIFPASIWSAWACSYGLGHALRRMGHEVFEIPMDPNREPPEFKPKDMDSDGIIISGPEHLQSFLVPYFEKYRSKVPRIGWMHETVDREDYGKLDLRSIDKLCPICFCPGIQDKKYGLRYLPFGVDTNIFFPDENTRRNIPVGFIGLMYGKRQEFYKKFTPHLNGIKLRTGNVQVLELDGINIEQTARLYAQNLRRIKVFVNLPTLSQLAVTKVYEVLACGTYLLTPVVNDINNFDGIPADLYEPRDPAELSNRVRAVLERDNEYFAERGRKNFEDMNRNHRLELRCEKLVAAIKEAA